MAKTGVKNSWILEKEEKYLSHCQLKEISERGPQVMKGVLIFKDRKLQNDLFRKSIYHF